MLTLHPQYIKDAEGNNSLLVLTAEEFDRLIEELEDAEDMRLFDEAKKEDDGERILFANCVKNRKAKNT
jgi:hypothetical protein